MINMYRVFIVEDDPMVLSINERFVNKMSDFKVVGTSSSGTEALEAIHKLKPDLLLLDIFMPGKNGLDILKQLRHSENNCDVIMITAAQDVSTISESLRLGVLDYLIKPYDFNRLKKSLESFLKKMELINESKTLTQKELDEIHFIKKDEQLSNNKTTTPKGLDDITLEKVINVIESSNKALSSTEVGIIMSVSRITARKYLEYLVDTKHIEIQLKYGNTGRPTRQYKKKDI